MYFENITTHDPGFSENTSSERYDPIDKGSLPAIVFMLVLLVIGIIGNTQVLIVYTFLQKKKSTYIVFVIALASIDLATCCFQIPVDIVDLFHPYDFFSSAFCKIQRCINAALFINSMVLLVLIAICRFRHIYYPFKPHWTVAASKKLSILCILIGSVLALPVLYFMGLESTKMAPGKIVKKCFFDENVKTQFALIYIGFLNTLFGICLITLVILYSFIGIRLVRSRNLRKRMITKRENESESITNISFTSPKCNSLKDVRVNSRQMKDDQFSKAIESRCGKNPKGTDDNKKPATDDSIIKNKIIIYTDIFDKKRKGRNNNGNQKDGNLGKPSTCESANQCVLNDNDYSKFNSDNNVVVSQEALSDKLVSDINNKVSAPDSFTSKEIKSGKELIVPNQTNSDVKMITDKTNSSVKQPNENAIIQRNKIPRLLKWIFVNTASVNRKDSTVENIQYAEQESCKCNITKGNQIKIKKTMNEVYQVTKISFLITAIFIIAFLPYGILGVYLTLNPEFKIKMTVEELCFYRVGMRMAYINNVANCFIYGIFDKRFQKLSSMLYNSCLRHLKKT